MSSTTTNAGQTTTAGPVPKTMVLAILVDWSNRDERYNTSTSTSTSTSIVTAYRPCWLTIQFAPPKGTSGAAEYVQGRQWQFTFNICGVERIHSVKNDEEPIPKERRALLWFNEQPFGKYRYAVVAQHTRFPVSFALRPRVIAFRADSAEPEANALVWVRKTTGLKQYKEDSYLKVVRGHTYRLSITFPDGPMVNLHIAQGWGFTASLHGFKRKHGHINTFPLVPATQIRASWLDIVDADLDADELEMARAAKFQDERDDQRALAEEKAGKSDPFRFVSMIAELRTTIANSSCSSTVDATAKKKAVAGWTQADIDALVYATSSSSTSGTYGMPSYAELASFAPSSRIDLRPEIESFFDGPPDPPPSAAFRALVKCPEPVEYSASDKELLSLFRALEIYAERVASDSNSKVRDAALRLTQFFSTRDELVGWQNCEDFIRDPSPRLPFPVSPEIERRLISGATYKKREKGKMDGLIETSEALLKKAMTRASWVLEIDKNVGKQLDGKTLERTLGVLLKDTQWMTESASFLKNFEQAKNSLVANTELFGKFQERSKRGVEWPHSPKLRRQIEKACFVFRPMMIRRDRCVCNECGVEVSGWKPWHNPWHFHNWRVYHRKEPPREALDLGFPTIINDNMAAAAIVANTAASTTAATNTTTATPATTTTTATTTTVVTVAGATTTTAAATTTH